ncbi:glycosyltransferase family 2 protein [Nocardioides terrae]|nr:glycosyltransferase family A protein [Nocardioides terrae]
MPVHNASQYVDEALRSVLKDLVDDAEVVIVDDGSTDATAAILKRYVEADARVTVLTNPAPTGVSRALNQAITRPGCPEFVAVAEHDDVTLPGRFAAQLAALDDAPDLGAVSSVGRYVGPDGRIVGRFASGPINIEEFEEQRARGKAILIPHPCVMYRRAALDDVGLYDSSFDGAQDLELFNRLIYLGGWRVMTLTTLGIHYRMHAESMSFAKMSAQRAVDNYIWYRNRQVLDNQPYVNFEQWCRERKLTARQRLMYARRDRGALLYRRAGLAWLTRRPISFALNLLGAALLHPRWVLLKVRVARG